MQERDLNERILLTTGFSGFPSRIKAKGEVKKSLETFSTEIENLKGLLRANAR